MGIIFFKISLGFAVILSLFFFLGCLVCDTDNDKSKKFWQEVFEWTKVSWVVFFLSVFSLVIISLLDSLLNVGHQVLAML
jgi:hypothetical protein